MNFEKFFSNTCFIVLFYVQHAGFQPAYTLKKYFIGALQAFRTRTRSSHSKAFIYLKSLKIICEEVNSKWSCEMSNCKFTKKTFTHPPSCIFVFLFSERITITSFVRDTFRKYKWKVVLLVLYLFNYDSSKWTFFMLSTVFVK